MHVMDVSSVSSMKRIGVASTGPGSPEYRFKIFSCNLVIVRPET